MPFERTYTVNKVHLPNLSLTSKKASDPDKVSIFILGHADQCCRCRIDP